MLEGEGLKVGGLGLQKLYDSDFRNVVNNLPAVKKAGQKVGSVSATIGDKPTFSGDIFGGDLQIRLDQIRHVWDGPGRTAEGWQYWNVSYDRQAKDVLGAMRQGASYADAMIQHGSVGLADKLGGKFGPREDVSGSVHSLAITPQIRESVMSGQPLAAMAPGAATRPGRPVVEAKSVEDLLSLLDAGKTGLSPKQAEFLRALLDNPKLAATLEGIRFHVTDALSNGWNGSFFDGLVTIVSGKDPAIAIEEVLHAVMLALPKEMQTELERLRVQSINNVIEEEKASDSPDTAKIAALESLRDKPTAGANDFLSRNFPDSFRNEIYQYSNWQEYGAQTASKRFEKKAGSTVEGFWQQLKDFIRGFIRALRGLFRSNGKEQDIFDTILAGDFTAKAVARTGLNDLQAAIPEPGRTVKEEFFQVVRVRDGAGLGTIYKSREAAEQAAEDHERAARASRERRGIEAPAERLFTVGSVFTYEPQEPQASLGEAQASLPTPAETPPEEKRAQVGGIPEIGQRRPVENIGDIQAKVREVGFDARQAVTPENTAKAWEIFEAMTNPDTRGTAAQNFKNAFGGTNMSLGLFQGEIRNYALKLAAAGDRSLFVSLLNRSADFETLTGGGDTAAGQALRAAREFASSPMMAALEEVLTRERDRAAAQGLKLSTDNFDRLMRALDDLTMPSEQVADIADKAAEVAAPTPSDMSAEQAAMRKAARYKAIGPLIEEIQRTPLRTQRDPAWRKQVAERWFKLAGLTDEQAAKAAELFSQNFDEAYAKASELVVREELKGGRLDTISEVIAAIRAGVMSPGSEWLDRFAEKAGWRRPTNDELTRLVDLDAKLGDESLSPAEVAAVHEDMLRIVRHFGKHEGGFMKAMAERFVGGLLSGIRTFTIQFTPVIQAIRDLAIASSADPKNARAFARAMYNAARANMVVEAKYAWQHNAYKFHLGELDLTHNQLDRIWAEAEEQYRTGNATQKAWARVRQLYAINRFVFKVLNTLDNTMMSGAREWKLAYYGSIAFKEAGLKADQVSDLVDAMALARQASYERAKESGADELTARVRANHEVVQAVHDFIANRTGSDTTAAQVLDAAEKDAYSMVGRRDESIQESDEGMLSRLFPNDFMEFLSKLRAQGGAKSLIGTATFGFVNIPYRTVRYASAFSPYGLLRWGINRYRNTHGKEQWWKQSFANETQARARFREAMAGTVLLLLATAWAIFNHSSDDKAGDEDFGLYITGNGPKNRNLIDAWRKRGFRPYSLNFIIGGRVVAIPVTRVGEMIMFPFMLPAGLDDAEWRRKEAAASGHPIKSEVGLYTAALIGSSLNMMGQKGIFQTVGRLTQSMEGGDRFEKALAKLGASVGSAIALPLKQLLSSLSSMFVGPLDQSSATALIAANLPIVGYPWQQKAVNRFGDPFGDRSWYGRLADTGIPIAFQLERSPENERLYPLLVSKGVAPPELRRYILEERFGPLTDAQFGEYARRSGAHLKSEAIEGELDLSAMSPEDAKQWLTKAATRADRIAESQMGLTRRKASEDVAGGGRTARSAQGYQSRWPAGAVAGTGPAGIPSARPAAMPRGGARAPGLRRTGFRVPGRVGLRRGPSLRRGRSLFRRSRGPSLRRARALRLPVTRIRTRRGRSLGVRV